MKKWEYNVMVFDLWMCNIEKKLTKLGKLGWELVSVDSPPTELQKEMDKELYDNKGVATSFIFKRPIE